MERFGLPGGRFGATAVLGNRSIAITRMGNHLRVITRKGGLPSTRMGSRIITTTLWPFRAWLALKG